MNNKTKKRLRQTVLFAVNIVSILLLIFIFYAYNSAYHQKLLNQNINDISHLNQSAAAVSRSFFENQQWKLRDLSSFIKSNKLTYRQALKYMYLLNTNQNLNIEMVGSNYTGHIAVMNQENEFISVSYVDESYSELAESFKNIGEKEYGEVSFTAEFTDSYTAVKSFGLCTPVSIVNEDGGNDIYALLCVTKSSEFLKMINHTMPANMSTVLMDKSGNYIIGNEDFKSSNFFQYLKVFNDLSLDEINDIKKGVLSSDSGVLKYKNSVGKECYYTYVREEDCDWYSVSCVPASSFSFSVMDYGFTITVAVVLIAMMAFDVLWLVILNRKLKSSMEFALEASAAKTSFLSRMSHDIRTPLNAVIGFAEIAGDEQGLSQTASDCISKIQTSGKYLLGLLNDVLDMAKIESGKISIDAIPMDSRRLFDEINEIFAADASSKGIRLIADFSGLTHRYVMLDPLRTRQIFSNLISNAIKFSKSDTEITWRVESVYDEQNGKATYTSVISDHGCGMSADFLKCLFTPFEQERSDDLNKPAGSGLGLAIVKNLVELMNGHIEVESQPGVGSVFTITVAFDAVSESEFMKGQCKSVDRDIDVSGKRILVCEDHPLNLQIITRLLEKKQIIVETAENGKQGFDKFAASSVGYYNMVLMDIRMPVMGGLEATRMIRSLKRSDAAAVPIIAMTANAYDEDRQNSKEAGMNEHLVKPIQTRIFYDTIYKYFS